MVFIRNTFIFYLTIGDRRGRVVVGVTTTCAIRAYHH